MRKDMCVYMHLDKDGVVRYIGSGTKDRPYFKYNRNAAWNTLFMDEFPTVLIVEDGLIYEDALALEYYLYESCKSTIVNLAPPIPNRSLDFEMFNEWFYYDETSPSFLRLKKRHCFNNINKIDEVVGTKVKSNGKTYWRVKLFNRAYLAHRVIYLLANGLLNTHKVINHIDGNGLNNNINNLEEVTQRVNCFKRKIRCTNTTGYSGITERFYKKNFDAYMVGCKGDGFLLNQRFSLTVFGSKENALLAAREWRTYVLHINSIEIYTGDISELAKRVTNSLVLIEKVQSTANAYMNKAGKWACRLKLNNSYKNCGTFSTKEEAEIARDKILKAHNDSITISLDKYKQIN